MSFTIHVHLFLYRLYKKMAMEVILSTAFGRAVDVQGRKGEKLFEAAVTAFGAFSPSKEDERMNIYRILQVAIGKTSSTLWVAFTQKSTKVVLTVDQLMK